MAKRAVVTEADLDWAVRDAAEAESPNAVIERIMAAVGDPALRGPDFSVGAALATVSELQARYGRPDEAEATLRRAIADDAHGEFVDARAWLAALLVGQGRPDAAAAEFALLEESGRVAPDDYLSYGEALEAAGEFPGAVNAFAAGELLAERVEDTGLATMLRRSADRARNGGVPSAPVPALAGPDLGTPPDADSEPAVVLCWSRADHERVVAEWPTMAAEFGGDWNEHRVRIERHLVRATETGAVPLLARCGYESFAPHAGAHPTIATLDGFVHEHADELDIVVWPPDRNVPCWCGSGRKYKRCCRP
jgi:SEC-C motif